MILQVKCFQWRREMLMLFYQPEKQGSLAHAEVFVSAARDIFHFRSSFFRLVWESLLSVRK